MIWCAHAMAAVIDLTGKRQPILSMMLRLGRIIPARKHGGGAYEMAHAAEARALRAAYCIRRAYGGGEAGERARRAPGAGDPRGGVRVVDRAGRLGLAGDARARSGRGIFGAGRDRRPVAFRESAPADGRTSAWYPPSAPRATASSAAASPRRAMAGRGASGRGRLDLSASTARRPDKQASVDAAPRRCARLPGRRRRGCADASGRSPQGEAPHRRHHGDCPRDGGLHLGHRPRGWPDRQDVDLT